MVRADVALAGVDDEAQAVVGSFTVDGLTYAIDGEDQVALVAVEPLGEGAEGDGAEGADAEAAEGEGSDAAGPALTLPARVTYGGADYSLVRIAPLALAGCGAASLLVPETVAAIDTAAALGCDTLEEAAVDEGNSSFSTFDGYLTDKARSSILLVPEGRVGQLRIASTIQDLDPRVFSHCARLTSLDVDAGCPGLASWDGSVYTSDLSTLLRVPAGAEVVVLPPECTAIGASAFSGCTALRSIEAQGSVASIAPSAFGEVEEVQALPSAALGASAASDDADARPVQLTGLVAVASSALSSIQIDKSAVSVTLAEGADPAVWQAAGFSVGSDAPADDAADDADADDAAPTPAVTLAASVISEDVELGAEEDEITWTLSESASTYAATYDIIKAYEPTKRIPVYSCTYTGSCYARQYTYTPEQGWSYRDFTGTSLSLGAISAHKFVGLGFWQFGNPEHDTTVTLLKATTTLRLNTLSDGSHTWSYSDASNQWIEVAVTSTFKAASTVSDGNLVSSIAAMPPYVPMEACAVVSWDPNGGTCDTALSKGLPGSAIESPIATFKPGYEFAGWFDDPRTGRLVALPGEPLVLEEKDYELYAHWSGSFAITYVNEDGSAINAEGSDVTVDPPFFLQPTYRSDERVIVDAVPVREGYEFLGWTIEGITGDEPQKQAIIPAGTTGDLVAVAHWQQRNYLYTVKDGTGAAGSTSPKAWWTLDSSGQLYIQCDTENGETAVIAQRNFPGWHYNTPDKQEAWGAVRDQVRSITISEAFAVEQSASYTREYVSANATVAAGYNAPNEGMSWWFTWMPNLKDISGLRIPDGIACAGLFWGCWGLETLEGAYGTFQMPEACGNWNGLLGCTGLKELPEGFTIPEDVIVIRCMFQGVPLAALPEGFSVPSTLKNGGGAFKNCPELTSLPASLKISSLSGTSVPVFSFDTTQDVAGYPRDYVEWCLSRAGGSAVPATPVRTLYSGNLADLLPGGMSGTAKEYWLDKWNRELVGPGDLTSPQSAVRFQVPKADGSGYVTYDVLTDASGRALAPAVTKYGYSKVTWRYDTGTSGADLGHIAVTGPCGSEALAVDAASLPEIAPGLKGPVYAEVSGLMLSMDMPVGSGNLWYAIDCGEVIALGSSASERESMADAHELSFESYTPVPTELSATFTANASADGIPAAEKLFPSGLDAGTGFALSLDGGASATAGFKGLIDAGGSQGFDSLAELGASPSVREPGRATGTLALKLGGTNDVDFAEEVTEYSVADIVWTLDASAQYDFWAADDAAVYGTCEIKAAADAIVAYGASNDVPAYRQYHRYLEQQSPDADPVFSIKVYDQPDGSASVHSVDVLGIAQDTKTSGGKAGLTFGWHDIYAYDNKTSDEAGAVSFASYMRSLRVPAGGWNATELKGLLQEKNDPASLWNKMGEQLRQSIAPLNKGQQLYGGATAGYLERTSNETIWLASTFEVFGYISSRDGAEALTTVSGYTPFQYQYYAKGGTNVVPNSRAIKTFNGTASFWWTRSVTQVDSYGFGCVSEIGEIRSPFADLTYGVVPCFAF